MRPAGEVTTAGPANQSPDGCGPGVYRLGITRGDDLRRVFELLDAAGGPLPMGGVVAHAQVTDSAGNAVADWSSEGGAPRLFLADGEAVLYVPGAELLADPFQPGRPLWWSLRFATQFGQLFTFLVGPVSVFKGSQWQP